MNKKFGLSILCLSSSLTLMSCNFVIDSIVLKSLLIEDPQTSYQLGQTYIETTSLTITGINSDDTTRTFKYSEVNFSLTCNGNSYSVSQPFTVEGTYSLKVTVGAAKSNTITFNVTNEPIYVTSLEVNGDSSVSAEGKKTLTLVANPSDSNVDINATSSDESILTIKKLNRLNFEVSGITMGEATITFSSLSGENEPYAVDYQMTVTQIATTTFDASQTYYPLRSNGRYRVAPCPLSGELKLLVVPLWFTDSGNFINEAKKENVREDINKAYNGTVEETGFHSVSSYYYEESRQSLHISANVAPWYESGISSTEASNKTDNCMSLIKSATNWYFSHSNDSRSSYDLDNDGYLDGVIVIYGAPDYSFASLDYTSVMWAFCYWIGDSTLKNPSNPGPNSYFWASYDFMYSSGEYATSRAGSTYGRGDTRHCTVDAHTYIHEMGHIFGLDDYYDYNIDSNRNPLTNPAGGFSMQDNNVGAHDPFSVLALGWGEVYIPTHSCEITLSEFQSSHAAILLTPNFNSYNSPFDEYLLLELYSPTGLNNFDTTYRYSNIYPQGVNDVGIRLWHVDARLVYGTGTNMQFTSDATRSGTVVGLNNNSATIEEQERICPAGRGYQKFDLLHLIRNNVNATTSIKDDLKRNDLFYEGQSFDMATYSKQFTTEGKLDKGVDLGWTFAVSSIFETDGVNKATITLNRVVR